MAVFVLDKQKHPLMPCTEKRARLLLERGRAVVVRLAPFTLRLKDRIGGAVQPLRLKLDPGSRVTGLAIVRESETCDPETGAIERLEHGLWFGELAHRGQAIREALTLRRHYRRARRSRKTRYRAPRFLNRTRREGWLPPSLQHRLDTTLNWVARLRRLAPITALSQELVRFDTQALQNPEISGVEYQQGELAGYEVREYLLETWHRTCAYCGATNVPLEIEHIVPRARGGSDRVSNLTLACRPCNQRKGNRSIEDFLKRQPALLHRIQAQAKAPLQDAAAVNATRWALLNALQTTGLAVETGSGGRTKFNRTRLDIPKTHALDAACVGAVDQVRDWNRPVLAICATGRGAYSRTRTFNNGFPRGYLMRHKRVHGFQTGDWVRAEVPKGKKAGVHVGRVAVRQTGSFNIQAQGGTVQGVSYRHCRVLQRADGYGYAFQPKPDTEKARRAA
ncbi:RNA-guided endonuclease IscB [Allochromatium vinosum]|uniref:HNH endonuclease n=1 Tax=Allochromatium vinosum (strain ATCC 17899 / DSM 180 / NBRC 103801 / NCIMB 10441 / D) TaxID=572477 RepID=D3RRU0_ALLVD|nr:RNA-guided endonuclease IscB [Allochromatium vinosum]ADC61994.1 HNH endonuclease [Allochromatium vinosum DSM 180]